MTSRRNFLKTGAASLTGLTALTTFTQPALANRRHITVTGQDEWLQCTSMCNGVGDDITTHYAIKVTGDISKGGGADSNDDVLTDDYLEGEVQTGYQDDFYYTGHIEYIRCDGCASFSLDDNGLGNDTYRTQWEIEGTSSYDSRYSVSLPDGEEIGKRGSLEDNDKYNQYNWPDKNLAHGRIKSGYDYWTQSSRPYNVTLQNDGKNLCYYRTYAP
ncbi:MULTISPECIES: twin-arginine translocation signal domain-containing protein [unclassified Haladaptatus]|uniref:twin-arginine translocation signal domain-containing protein n=1 Tax=unclassified Haladaptatus TaxID=2622732 RepID=UPI0023E878F9|nr:MULTISPECIES: twin-arginine translocation signal domain-containing protein [unclassified Haladaptatus]